MATLGPGSIVRWKGVSPQCSHPERHQLIGGVGTVIAIRRHFKLIWPDHTLRVRLTSGRKVVARPDEVEVIDEFGVPGDVEAQRLVEANVAGHVHVGVAA